MKKTVVFNFPDDFKFPEYYGWKVCTGCPFDTSMDDNPLCFLTGDDGTPEHVVEAKDGKIEQGGFEVRITISEADRHKCPFYCGAETVNYDDC